MRITRIKEPLDVLPETASMSEWEIMRQCYGPDVDTLRIGNSGRIMAVRRVLREAGMTVWSGTNGAVMWARPQEGVVRWDAEKEASAEKLKKAAVVLLVQSIRATTSWGKFEDLESKLEEYGYTGPFTGLDRFFDGDGELLDALEVLWNINHAD